MVFFHNAISAHLKICNSALGSPTNQQRYLSPCRSPHLLPALIGYRKSLWSGPEYLRDFSILPG